MARRGKRRVAWAWRMDGHAIGGQLCSQVRLRPKTGSRWRMLRRRAGAAQNAQASMRASAPDSRLARRLRSRRSCSVRAGRLGLPSSQACSSLLCSPTEPPQLLAGASMDVLRVTAVSGALGADERCPLAAPRDILYEKGEHCGASDRPSCPASAGWAIFGIRCGPAASPPRGPGCTRNACQFYYVYGAPRGFRVGCRSFLCWLAGANLSLCQVSYAI